MRWMSAMDGVSLSAKSCFFIASQVKKLIIGDHHGLAEGSCVRDERRMMVSGAESVAMDWSTTTV